MPIYIPSPGVHAWQALLADPVKHWREGYSAHAIAHAWEAANGLPAEIDALYGGGTELLIAIPEHKVPLPGGQRPSQCDVFALARADGQTIAMAVEGKVNEPFGPLIGDWLADESAGKVARLKAIGDMLGCDPFAAPALHYQLFHRTAAAIVEARRFKTDRAAMIVHSMSPKNMWFDAFSQFAKFVGVETAVDRLVTHMLPDGRPLDIGWAKGVAVS